MDRMDEWEDYFRSEDFGSHKSEQATFEAIHLVRGGCYDALVDNSPVDQQALFCIEYFGAAQGDEDEKVADHLRSREVVIEGANLDFVLRRIGALGPNPGCLAVWSFESYVAMEPFQRLNLDDDPYRPEETGVYRWFGRDIL